MTVRSLNSDCSTDMLTNNKSTRVTDAYLRLKAEILQNTLPAGYQAPEPDIAARLGMSRTPVREALIRLESDGLVDLVPRRGAKVLGLTLQDLSNIYEILTALEPAAVAGVAAGGLAGAARADLDSLVRKMERAVEDRQFETWLRADDAFHRTLVAAHGNPRLARLVGGLLDQLFRGRLVLVRMSGAPMTPPDWHWSLLDAIADTDPARVAAMVADHRRDALRAFQELFSSCGLHQV